MAYLDFKGTVSSVVEYISIYLLLPLQTLTILFFMLKVYAEKANITLAGNWFRHIGFFAVSLIFELLFVLNFIQLAA